MGLLTEIILFYKYKSIRRKKNLINNLIRPFKSKYKKIWILLSILLVFSIALIFFIELNNSYKAIIIAFFVFFYFELIDFEKGEWKHYWKQQHYGKYLDKIKKPKKAREEE